MTFMRPADLRTVRLDGWTMRYMPNTDDEYLDFRVLLEKRPNLTGEHNVFHLLFFMLKLHFHIRKQLAQLHSFNK